MKKGGRRLTDVMVSEPPATSEMLVLADTGRQVFDTIWGQDRDTWGVPVLETRRLRSRDSRFSVP